jgi:hypothetical protein
MFRRVWERWKVVAHKIGTFQSRVLLTIFYVLILLPFGVGIRLLSDLRAMAGVPWGQPCGLIIRSLATHASLSWNMPTGGRSTAGT